MRLCEWRDAVVRVSLVIQSMFRLQFFGFFKILIQKKSFVLLLESKFVKG